MISVDFTTGPNRSARSCASGTGQQARRTGFRMRHHSKYPQFAKRTSWQKPMLRVCIAALLPATILLSAGAANAQPCFTAMQCAQIRINNDRLMADQQAAQAAAEAARIRHEQQVAREVVKERARQAADQQQAQIEQERAQVQWRAEQARAQAEADQRAQEAGVIRARQQADAEQRAQEAAVIRARQQADAEQRAQEAALIRGRQQVEQQAAYAEQKRRAAIEEENRAAAQLAAENSPDNHCRDRKIAGSLIDNFNGLQAVSDYNARAVDIDHLTTVRFDAEHQAMSCHGSFILQSGVGISGTIMTRLNVAGRLLTEFHRD
jgi:hypothetical protein